MNDLTLQKARAYEAEHGAAISPEERPAYHLTPYVAGSTTPTASRSIRQVSPVLSV